MALNPEVAAFAARVDTATNNIAADIARILANSTTQLSTEDRDALEGVVSRLEALDAENPDGTAPTE